MEMDELLKEIMEGKSWKIMEGVTGETPEDLQEYMDFFGMDQDALFEMLDEKAQQLALTIAVASSVMPVGENVIVQTILLDSWIEQHERTKKKMEEDNG